MCSLFGHQISRFFFLCDGRLYDRMKHNRREGFTMKRLVVVLSGLLALPAFAEVAPFYYTDAIEYSDAEYADDGVMIDTAELVAGEEVAPQSATPAKINPRVAAVASRTVGRTVPAANGNARRTSDANSRVVAARTTTSRTAVTPSRSVESRGALSRAAANATPGVSTRRVSSATPANAARTGTTTAVVKTSSGSTESVFEDNNLYTSRVGVRSSASARVPTVRVASATISTGDSVSVSKADTTAAMDELAELTDFCRAQYNACMDNFCNVLDDNQGRCSCSKNLKNYEKTEQALKAATEELQDVAQKIQYIGLTGDEISTLFTETEAEEAMRGKSDSSQIKTSLDKIKNMIVDVKTGTASVSSDSSMSFDLSNLLDFSISSTGFDLSTLFGVSTGNTSSISNQRGETLYKTAASRCKTSVLNSCAAQGVDASVITNAYDLEIDKQCIAYERSLSDANTEMTSTVRNAKTVLQKARLMVAQQRNQYDLRGCISALDSCMQDDYVCGADYENCLDPSGKYIVNGQVVVGSMPGKALNEAKATAGMLGDNLYDTWKYGESKNAWGTTSGAGDLSGYIADTLTTSPIEETDNNMSKFLQYKIGYHDNTSGKNMGMCMSVLNKCQDYTYDENRKYVANNSVISEYLYRTMIQIKAAQDTVLSNYAENCISDVTSCLSSNGYDSVYNTKIPVNACKSVITTCMSVNGNVTAEPDPNAMLSWASYVYGASDSTASNSVIIQNYSYCLSNDGLWDDANKQCTCKGSGYTWTTDATGLGTCVSSSND